MSLADKTDEEIQELIDEAYMLGWLACEDHLRRVHDWPKYKKELERVPHPR